MNRFEYRSTFTGRSRRKQSHRAADNRTFVSQNIPECIFSHHHVKESWFLDHLHGSIIHKHIVSCHLRIIGSHFLCNLTPQTGRSQNICLVYHSQVLSAFHCIFKSNFQDTFNFRTSVVVCIVCFIIILIFLTEVHTAGQLTDADEIRILNQFRTQRRFMDQAFECLYRTNISKQSQFLTHCQQSLLRTNFRSRVIIKLRITYGRKQNSICILANLICFFRERITYFINRICTADCIFVTYFVAKLLANGTHYIYTLYRNLRSDTVAC